MKLGKVTRVLTLAVVSCVFTAGCAFLDETIKTVEPESSIDADSEHAEVEEETASLPAPTISGDQRDVLDGTPHDVAAGFFHDLLTFNLAEQKRTDIENSASKWITTDAMIGDGLIPYPWAEQNEFQKLIADEAVFSVHNVLSIDEEEPVISLSEEQHRYLVEFEITRDGHKKESHSMTYVLRFERSEKFYWLINSVGVQG